MDGKKLFRPTGLSGLAFLRPEGLLVLARADARWLGGVPDERRVRSGCPALVTSTAPGWDSKAPRARWLCNVQIYSYNY